MRTRACGRGLGPGNREFFGPCEMGPGLRVFFFGLMAASGQKTRRAHFGLDGVEENGDEVQRMQRIQSLQEQQKMQVIQRMPIMCRGNSVHRGKKRCRDYRGRGRRGCRDKTRMQCMQTQHKIKNFR